MPETNRTEPLDVQRERARRAVTKALRANGLDHPTRTDWAVQQALDGLDIATASGWLRQIPARDGVPGLTVIELAGMLCRDALELEPVLDDAVRRGQLVRVDSGGMATRYAVLR
jgi:hypothetical protein